MNRLSLICVSFFLLLAACSNSATEDTVASLTEADPSNDAPATVSSGAAADEAALNFAACMRDNGVEGFQDPIMGPDGKIEFLEKAEGDDAKAAYLACRPTLEGLTIGGDKYGGGAVEGQDALYEFAVCMREFGFDMPDPDKVIGVGEIDKNDPDFVAGYEQCSGSLSGGK